MSLNAELTWPDSKDTPLREGDSVRYHGSISRARGMWIFEGPCKCESCVTEYFDACDRYRPMRHAANGRHLHIPHRHVLRHEDGSRLECVPESDITAPRQEGQPAAAMLTVDVGALAIGEHQLWLLDVDAGDGTTEVYGERTVCISRDWTGPVIELAPGIRHTGPPHTAAGGVQLWRWDESADCLLALFGDKASMQAGARALTGRTYSTGRSPRQTRAYSPAPAPGGRSRRGR